MKQYPEALAKLEALSNVVEHAYSQGDYWNDREQDYRNEEEQNEYTKEQAERCQVIAKAFRGLAEKIATGKGL